MEEDEVRILPSDEGEKAGSGGRWTQRFHSLLCSPLGRTHRFLVLAFMCFLNFGNYYCFDNPAALEDKFTGKDGMGLPKTTYGLLYTVYAWPNVVFPLIGGMLIDGWLGIRVASIVFSAFIMCGQVVFAAGGLVDSVGLMLAGRVLFAVGGENLAVCQNNYAVKWFKGKELNTVFGIQLSFARFGSTVNMYAMAPIYMAVRHYWSSKPAYFALGMALLIGGLSTIVSFSCSLILAYLDRRRDIIIQEEKEEEGSEESEARVKCSSLLGELVAMPGTLGVLCIVCVAYYNAVFPLVGFGLLFYESKFHLSSVSAETVNSLIYLISIVASPICGGAVDYWGSNLSWVGLATLMSLGAHLLLGFTFITPYLGVAILGIAYSAIRNLKVLAASLWSCVAYIVPERLLGTAYGVVQSVQNLGQGIIFIGAGAILDAGGYFMLELFFLFWLSIALAFIVLLFFLDRAQTGGVLSMDRIRQKAYLESRKDL